MNLEFSGRPETFRSLPQERSRFGSHNTVRARFSARPSATFRGLTQGRNLPSAPSPRGIAAFVGRFRECPAPDCAGLSHNSTRGAAGAATLNAQLMHSEGMLD